jgi:uncharacterized protein (DUF2141 family)
MSPLRRLAPLAAAALALSAAPASAQQCTGRPSATRLFVSVSNIRSSEGLIAVTLYADDSSRFLARRGSLYVGRVLARAGVTRVCIHVPAPGTYGLAVYHDANANRRFDRNMIGLPAEGYGFSNNAPTLFGLPRFASVRLAVPRDGFATSVRLRYP